MNSKKQWASFPILFITDIKKENPLNNENMFMKVKSDIGVDVSGAETITIDITSDKEGVVSNVYAKIRQNYRIVVIDALSSYDFDNNSSHNFIKTVEYALDSKAITCVIVNENISELSYRRLKNAGATLIVSATPENLEQRSFFRFLGGFIVAQLKEQELSRRLKNSKIK